MTNLTPDELKGVIKESMRLPCEAPRRSRTRSLAALGTPQGHRQGGDRARQCGSRHCRKQARHRRHEHPGRKHDHNRRTRDRHDVFPGQADPPGHGVHEVRTLGKEKIHGIGGIQQDPGIVGIGRVGSIVADRAEGLKMHVIAYDPFMSPERRKNWGSPWSASMPFWRDRISFPCTPP